jgi:hypothetical protein
MMALQQKEQLYLSTQALMREQHQQRLRLQLQQLQSSSTSSLPLNSSSSSLSSSSNIRADITPTAAIVAPQVLLRSLVNTCSQNNRNLGHNQQIVAEILAAPHLRNNQRELVSPELLQFLQQLDRSSSTALLSQQLQSHQYLRQLSLLPPPPTTIPPTYSSIVNRNSNGNDIPLTLQQIFNMQRREQELFRSHQNNQSGNINSDMTLLSPTTQLLHNKLFAELSSSLQAPQMIASTTEHFLQSHRSNDMLFATSRHKNYQQQQKQQPHQLQSEMVSRSRLTRNIDDEPTNADINNISLPLSLLRLPCILAQKNDALKLSAHQCLLRHQIEAFHATPVDATTHTRGRNKPIVIGQVGIRCIHCAHLPIAQRQKGSTYFPSSVLGLYQAAQNMSTMHIQCGLCQHMSETLRTQFAQLLATKTTTGSSGAGRPYWAESARKLGLVDTAFGIHSIRNLPLGIQILEPSSTSGGSKQR